MLEVSKKQAIKTRKEHDCYGCCETIKKASAAIHVRGKEDGHYRSLHLHVHCHITIMKRGLLNEGLKKGVLKQPQGEDYNIYKSDCPF